MLILYAGYRTVSVGCFADISEKLVSIFMV
jgi:hypothetical protein